MNCKEIQDLIIAYKMQEISQKEEEIINLHVKTCKECAVELEKTTAFLDRLNKTQEEIPSFRLQENFTTFLNEEIEKESQKIISLKPSNNWKTSLRVVASIVLIIGTFFLGKFSNQNESDQNKNKTAMLALLENESASKRILAVSKLEKSSIKDKTIINALINKLFIDENTNVRMAACEALTKFSSVEEVKNAFIKALETETAPVIQIELIQILTNIQEKRALVPMKKLLEKEETPNYVKQELTYNMASLI